MERPISRKVSKKNLPCGHEVVYERRFERRIERMQRCYRCRIDARFEPQRMAILEAHKDLEKRTADLAKAYEILEEKAKFWLREYNREIELKSAGPKRLAAAYRNQMAEVDQMIEEGIRRLESQSSR